MPDRYNNLATIFYDLDNKEDDILFYLDYAKKQKGEVLELGCGTGRISIPLVEQGIKITAVDYSNNMISRIRQKAKNIKNRNNLKIIRADLRSVNLNKKFNLIIMPFRVFQCLLTVDEQKMALKNIKRHLAKNGLLIFDIYYPNFKILSNIPTKEEIDAQFTFGQKKFIKTHINKKIDLLNQVVTTDIIYYEDINGKKKLISKNNIKMRYSFKFEIEHLLELSGFKIKKLLSDYKSKKFIVGKEIIFVCR